MNEFMHLWSIEAHEAFQRNEDKEELTSLTKLKTYFEFSPPRSTLLADMEQWSKEDITVLNDIRTCLDLFPLNTYDTFHEDWLSNGREIRSSTHQTGTFYKRNLRQPSRYLLIPRVPSLLLWAMTTSWREAELVPRPSRALTGSKRH